MALAINLLFDRQTSGTVESLWQAIADAGITRDMLERGYPPHVTLVVVDDQALGPNLQSALGLGQGRAVMPMTLGPARRFKGTDICWLAAEGAGLRDLQALVAATVPLASIREHYRPDRWIPHMTLTMQGDSDAAMAIADTMWPAPRRSMAVRIDYCSFVPVVRLGGTDFV